MLAYPEFFPQNIIGVDVFLERFQTRLYVGMLKKQKDHFHFLYDPIYLRTKNILPLGPEFPLTQREFVSKELFPSFVDRLPEPENPAYIDYCTASGIAITTTDPLVLLSALGKKGPSSFYLEPIYKDTFSYEDAEELRKKLQLSMQDFAHLFDVSLSSLQKVKAGEASGKEILKRLELYALFPEVLNYQIKRNGKWLHIDKLRRIMNQTKDTKERTWDVLTDDEAFGSQECLRVLRSFPWAQPLINAINNIGINTFNLDFLFESRFAAALALKGLTCEYEFKTGEGDCSVDFKVKGKQEWLIELVRLNETEDFKEAIETSGEFYSVLLNSPSTASELETVEERAYREKMNKRSQEGEMLKVQERIGQKVFDGKKTIKFPLPIDDGPLHMILIDMRTYLNGGDNNDYRQIAYGPNGVPEWDMRWCNKPISGLFEKESLKYSRAAKFLQERVHLIGFVSENRQYEKSIENTPRIVARNKYVPGKMLKHVKLVYNPFLFNTANHLAVLKNKIKSDFEEIILLEPEDKN